MVVSELWVDEEIERDIEMNVETVKNFAKLDANRFLKVNLKSSLQIQYS